MRVYYFAPENSGVAMYRFHQPLCDLEERKLIDLKGWGFDWTGKQHTKVPPTVIRDAVKWADVCVFGRRDDEHWQDVMHTIRAFRPDVPILLDIDDNIFQVSPYLPASEFYKPDKPALQKHTENAKFVDGIIVSTDFLKGIYDDFNEKVWVVPNGVKYAHKRLPRSEKVRIGYMMTRSHLENSRLVEGAVLGLLRNYPHVEFYYTRAFQGFMDNVPQDLIPRVNYVPFFPLKDYLQYVRNLNLDIGLAPLIDNDFNRSKSNIRVLEYWQNEIAVIASPLDEYRTTITDGFDGLFAEDDEWQHKMADLVASAPKRQYLVRNSKQTLAKYDIRHSADTYLTVLREVTT